MKTFLKIELPSAELEAILLGEAILTQHKKMGNNSILSNYDMKLFTDLVTSSRDLFDKIADLQAKITDLVQEKRHLLGSEDNQDSRTEGTLKCELAAIRDILQGFYRGKERKLEAWGYTTVIHKGKRGGKDNNIVDLPPGDDDTPPTE